MLLIPTLCSLNPDQQEPLEAGEDGTFDLGDPSPPPSPVVRTQQDAADESIAPSAEGELSGSPPIADDWEKVDLQGAEEEPALSTDNDSPPAEGSRSPEEPLEEFKDAIEMKPPQGTETSGSGVKEPASDKSEPSGPRPPPSAEQPAAVAVGKTAVIAAGLANVRLPMGYDRKGRLGGYPADSDGEEEFHDAHDSGLGMVKDATKAREMKEIGNE